MLKGKFTVRQLRTINLLVTGMTTKEIAAHLGTSDQTVKNAIKEIYAKAGTTNRVRFVLLYYKDAIDAYHRAAIASPVESTVESTCKSAIN